MISTDVALGRICKARIMAVSSALWLVWTGPLRGSETFLYHIRFV